MIKINRCWPCLVRSDQGWVRLSLGRVHSSDGFCAHWAQEPHRNSKGCFFFGLRGIELVCSIRSPTGVMCYSYFGGVLMMTRRHSFLSLSFSIVVFPPILPCLWYVLVSVPSSFGVVELGSGRPQGMQAGNGGWGRECHSSARPPVAQLLLRVPSAASTRLGGLFFME